MKNKRILVTGGAGFLGFHLCTRLLEQHSYVGCIDNLLTASPMHVQALQKNPRFQFIQQDITQQDMTSLTLKPPLQSGIDEIYNLACPASPTRYQKNPIHTLQTSVWGALHTLEWARHWGAKILQASTSEVYGDPLVHPQPESYAGNVNPIGPRACYDEGKRCAETLFFDYHRCYGVNIRVVRIFNTYGPHMHTHDGRVISQLIMQALRNKPLTLYGDGLQTRSFCYVDDLIDGMLAMMNAPDSVTGPVNLGNPAELTIRQLADGILAITAATSGFTYMPLPQNDPMQRQPDISLAKKLLGWQPNVSLQEGLKRTVAYFQSLERDPKRSGMKT